MADMFRCMRVLRVGHRVWVGVISESGYFPGVVLPSAQSATMTVRPVVGWQASFDSRQRVRQRHWACHCTAGSGPEHHRRASCSGGRSVF